MKVLILLVSVLLPLQSYGTIYKCVVNGKTVFSDTRCGKTAEKVDVSESTKPTGTQFSTDSMQDMGSTMGKERRKKELDRAIERQQKHVDKIINDYNQKRERLNDEMAEHKKTAYQGDWGKHPYKREKYYDKRRRIQNEIDETYRRYKSDKEMAYRKLNDLKSERRKLR